MSKRRPERARPIASAPPAPERGAAHAAALAAWAIAAALALAHGALGLVPTMHGWGLNLDRFLSPLSGWGLWLVALIALVPPLAARLVPWLARAGDALVRMPARATLVCAPLAAALALALPDRVRFVGDFLLRLNTLEAQASTQSWYPQALPLDLFLHATAMKWLTLVTTLDASGASRALGAVEAAGFAALAVALPRVLGLSGAAALTSAAALFCGGALTMFTGFDKAFSELCLVAAALGVFGLAWIREHRGLVPFGLALALGLTLHRSALALLPGAVAVWIAGARGEGTSGLRRPGAVLGIAIPIVALALVLPKIIGIVGRIDPMHLAPEDVRAQGFWAGTFGGLRMLDLANLVLMLSPLAPIALLGPLAGLERREAVVLLALAAPMVLAMPFIHPGQGYLRDWDDFAAAGVLVSLLVAVVLGAILRAAPRAAWVAPGLVLALAVASLQWVIHQTDLDRGLGRARAFMIEPPRRPASERYTTWMYLGVRNAAAERYRDAAASYREAAAVVPSPHILRQWAAAETMSGDLEGGRRVYRQLLAREPDDVTGWLGYAVASYRLQDWPETRRAARELLKRDSTQTEARRVLEELDRLHPEHGEAR